MAPDSKLTRAAKPRSNKVFGILRDRIRAGQYPSGEPLPSERALTEELGIHRRVVRSAIAQLETEGFLLRRPNYRPIVQIPTDTERYSGGSASSSRLASSRFIALLMWRGGGHLEQHGTAQQRIFWGMNHALGQAGYHTVFLDINDHGPEEENAVREAEHLRYVYDNGFGGVVFYPYAFQSNRELIQEVSRRVPLVLIDRTLPGIEADFVGIENRRALCDATSRLIAMGHKRLAYVTSIEPINTVQDRLRGYLQSITDSFGSDRYEMILTPPGYATSTTTMFDLAFGQPAGQRPTAVLCVNDYVAVRVAEHLAAMGLETPRDVSLVGFDSLVHTLPNGVGLTTVAQPFEEIGTAAANVLLRRLEGATFARAHIELPCEFIARESIRQI